MHGEPPPPFPSTHPHTSHEQDTPSPTTCTRPPTHHEELSVLMEHPKVQVMARMLSQVVHLRPQIESNSFQMQTCFNSNSDALRASMLLVQTAATHAPHQEIHKTQVRTKTLPHAHAHTHTYTPARTFSSQLRAPQRGSSAHTLSAPFPLPPHSPPPAPPPTLPSR